MPDSHAPTEEVVRQLTLKLAESDSRFHNIVSISTDGIVIVGSNGLIRFSNPAAASLFGRGVEELTGEDFGFPIVAGDTTELDVASKYGKTLIAEMRVSGTEWEGKPAYLATLRDVTERRDAELELRKLYRAMMQSPASIVITDTRGLIEYVNPKFTETTGFTAAEAVGKTPDILNSGQTPTEAYTAMWETINGGRQWRGEFVNRKKNGDIYIEAVSIAPVTDADGTIAHFVSVAEDVTDRKRAEEEIQRLNSALLLRATELEAANRDLEAFNYSVAHDLRQPLNIVSGYCQGIQMLCQEQLNEQCREFLQEAYSSTLRMNRLIDALLNFSRLRHVEPRRDEVDLSDLAQQVADELRRAHPERQVEVRIAKGVLAHGDADLLRVVLQNLLGNAWKYSSAQEKPVIEFGVRISEEGTHYFVLDNGIGFDMAEAEKLFVPFQRLSGTEQVRGLGIGLATVERIILRHGGRIWAEGTPGSGACFCFTLPSQPVVEPLQ
jgi:PAS domain S-box-containing protein